MTGIDTAMNNVYIKGKDMEAIVKYHKMNS